MSQLKPWNDWTWILCCVSTKNARMEQFNTVGFTGKNENELESIPKL